jgi:hypothetical protein
VPSSQLKAEFRLIEHKRAHERTPPNQHDLFIYTNRGPAVDGLLDYSPATTARVRRHEVAAVPGAFMLSDVLSVHEAHSLVRAAESAGYVPDVPMTDKKSILAHNVVWVPSAAMMTELNRRVQKHLPAVLGGGELRGLNGRFRFYRYAPGAVYRAHVDGAWPQCGVDEEHDRYIADASNGTVLSRLTVVMYLNDGFEGGCTTFLTPAAEQGYLDAKAVEPRCGCILVFPHGDTAGSLVHEGSGVIAGCKYIVRTEVLYTRANIEAN